MGDARGSGDLCDGESSLSEESGVVGREGRRREVSDGDGGRGVGGRL